jgi:hypothetical protein
MSRRHYRMKKIEHWHVNSVLPISSSTRIVHLVGRVHSFITDEVIYLG